MKEMVSKEQYDKLKRVLKEVVAERNKLKAKLESKSHPIDCKNEWREGGYTQMNFGTWLCPKCGKGCPSGRICRECLEKENQELRDIANDYEKYARENGYIKLSEVELDVEKIDEIYTDYTRLTSEGFLDKYGELLLAKAIANSKEVVRIKEEI